MSYFHNPIPPTDCTQHPNPIWLAYSDPIRILAIMAVVMGHLADMIMFNPPRGLGSQDWWISNLVNALCRWAVPVFVMLSGALLLNSPSSSDTRQFYSRRFRRVGIPLLCWPALYMLFSVYYTGWVSPSQAWLNLLQGAPYPHLHFCAVIAGLYLFTPMFRVFIQHAPQSMLWLTVILCLSLAACSSLAAIVINSPPNIFSRFLPFIGFYFAGYLLRDIKLSRIQFLSCIIMAIALIAVLAGSTGYFAMRNGMKLYPSWSMAAYDFASPPRILYGIVAWLILTNIFRAPLIISKRSHEFVSNWSSLTFGIYLIHPAIRDFLHFGINTTTPLLRHLPEWMWFNGLNATRPNIWLGLTSIYLMIYALSIILVILIKRLPFLKRIV